MACKMTPKYTWFLDLKVGLMILQVKEQMKKKIHEFNKNGLIYVKINDYVFYFIKYV